MCAAPGGKTTAIAILMKDEGEIIATDRSHNKVLDIQKLAAEMGLSCIKTFKLDALKSVCRRDDIDTLTDPCCNNAKNDVTNQVFDSPNLEVEIVSPIVTEGLNSQTLEDNRDEKTNGRVYVSKADARKNMRRARNGPGRNQSVGGRVERSKGFSPDSFDRVLLDAPCSALGLRPRLFAGEETIESLRNHAKYQRRMFDQAVQLVRPGGVIVYSTEKGYYWVSVNRVKLLWGLVRKGGDNVRGLSFSKINYLVWSLSLEDTLMSYSYLLFDLIQQPRIGGPGLVGSCEFPDGYVEEWLRPGEEELVQRFDPSSPLDTIGFFIAKYMTAIHEMLEWIYVYFIIANEGSRQIFYDWPLTTANFVSASEVLDLLVHDCDLATFTRNVV
ncbi:hypothetical protein V8G54_035048 [Vigna mungo]|uniref:SAM-dependent MTase RsmB/NOP-type domain-containing protein n=1 Tax=Vigna mungo TaxID=3915 RepID=A0AAQ3MFT2_VIGMU